MARTARASKGDICYHVINRGNNRATVFHSPSDYDFFINLIKRACDRLPMRVLAFCLMPNHFHLVLMPLRDGDLGRWMQWLLTCHVRRYHRLRGSSGRVWQGRFKAFPIQQDSHLLTVMRYVERNPLRANLVQHAADWKWSSTSKTERLRHVGLVQASPVPKPANWLELVDTPQSQVELDALRQCHRRNAPYGASSWVSDTARTLGLEASIRSIGRPLK